MKDYHYYEKVIHIAGTRYHSKYQELAKLLTKDRPTELTKRRYNRIVSLYDPMKGLVEKFCYRKWWNLLWSKLEGTRILEVDIGTGENFSYFPPDAEITAIDFSEKMLKRAQTRASKQKVKVRLQQMDVQNLEFEDNTFDTVIASFVFCSVPDPIRGMMEVARVCKPRGKVVLLEHVLSVSFIPGWFMKLANPLVVRAIGANINRQTVANVTQSGLVVE